jgi:hypothetical protein
MRLDRAMHVSGETQPAGDLFKRVEQGIARPTATKVSR